MLVYPKRWKSLLEFLTRHQIQVFFFLTLLAGVLIFSWQCDFQNYVSPGDHGRDLYAFKRVAETGAVPYRDFSWLFGPLMLYYYAAFFKAFGPTIQTAILGQNVLIIVTGALLFLIGSRFLSPFLAFLCALWYWAFRGQEFFYTYNHSGGLVCMLVMVYALFRYIEDGKVRHVILGLVAAFLFALIRFNMAFAILAGWIASLFMVDLSRKHPFFRRNARVYLYGALVCGLLVFFVYWLYFQGQPVYVLWESFPLTKAQRTDVTPGVMSSVGLLGQIVTFFVSSSPAWLCIAALFVFGVIHALTRQAVPLRESGGKVVLALVALTILTVFALHEFLVSGISYRLCWAFPLVLLIVFLAFGVAASGLRLVFKVLLSIALFWMAFTTIMHETWMIAQFKNPFHELRWGKNHVYTLQPMAWQSTVRGTCEFIQKNVPPGEKLFAVPFDTLYNFLTGRDQPTRQWVFFEHFIIPEEQDRKTIEDLEREKVNWILLSNRAIARDEGLGIFGRDCCHTLWKYIYEHYELVARYGVWSSRSSWGWDHGVIMYKRKVPFSGSSGEMGKKLKE